MNKVILIGRLTREPDIRYSRNGLAVAQYALAVDRKIKSGEQNVDFINCVAFGKNAEFVEKYLNKGTKIAVVGRIQVDSYTNRDGRKIETTQVVVDEHEFAESKNTSGSGNSDNPVSSGSGGMLSNGTAGEGWINFPDGIDEELPFN